jgi:hypothetical protein
MNLLEVRTQFVQLSGHYELASTDGAYTDNGADFYIRAGQDFLDRRKEFWKRSAITYKELAIGEWYTEFTRCRLVERVFVSNTTGRSKLTKKSILWLYDEYESSIAETENGTPEYYCPVNMRMVDYGDKDSLAEFFNAADVTSKDTRGVIILPPPDEAVVLEIHGQFYSTYLEIDTDESFWSVNHSDMLILAALYQLEILYHRNTQGANDYLVQLDRALDDLDKDVVEESIQEVTELEG